MGGWYLPHIFRGNRVASTKYTPQGVAHPERVSGAMEYNGLPDFRRMKYQNGVIMKYGSINA